jgi:ribosomal-protein-alanine N-acetyltransferase
MEKINLINLDDIKIINISNYTSDKIKEEYVDSIMYIENDLNIHILSKKNILEDLKNENYNYFVIKLKNEIIGYFAIFVLEYTTLDILAIAILNKYQKRGIASFALEYIINLSHKKNVNNILLEVRASNSNAIKLYEKYEFKNIHIRKSYYSNGENALIYEKNIQNK